MESKTKATTFRPGTDGRSAPTPPAAAVAVVVPEALEAELNIGRQLRIGLGMVLFMTLLTGIIYPLAVTGVAQLAFPSQANGSMLSRPDGRVLGSALLGQVFTDATYFHGRPSAGGVFDAQTETVPGVSGGSNLGPTNPRLVLTTTVQAANAIRSGESITGLVPVDLATTSASGLDPHITPAAAWLQVPRVAAARHLSATQVQVLVDQYIEGRDLGFLGEPRVNVLRLNLALDALQGGQ